MRGPLPPDSFPGRDAIDPLGTSLIRGQRYRIQRRFVELDGTIHDQGEEWYFVGSCFSRYDDLLTLYVADDQSVEWTIDLRWDEIVDDFQSYIASVPGQIRDEYFATARCPDCGSQLDRLNPMKCQRCKRVLSLA